MTAAVASINLLLGAVYSLYGVLTIIDLKANKVLQTVTLGGRPWGAIAARK